MNEISEHGTLGIVATVSAAIVGVAAVTKALPKVCASVLTAAKRIIQFNEAIPSILELPQTLADHTKILQDQNVALASLRNDLAELKKRP